ncbi:YwmB family TATA-box binding protein [Brevibacillus parabrevis]|uniref:YwmB family TATA-box binding protein n=1 Tax=Brevibacillus parabrevis TaxID=54914 RepID=UPI0028D8CAA0|nr:YwmB family TATA-box binding protein [Brevibacillus parabrevis]MED1722462.1 YwmB family TATA-box binding protein [Brevibacillus parabrevis]
MGKWSGLLVLALLLVTGAVHWMPAQASEAKPVASKLLQTLEDSGATGVSIQVRARVALGEVQRQEEVTELAKMWAKQLEIPLSLIEESRNHDVLMYRTTYKQNGISVRYEMTSVPENGSFDTYLVLELSGGRESLLYIEQIQETFAKALKNADFIPQISTCIRGLYNVKMSVDQQGGKIMSIFATLQATELERLQDETVVSISGHTPMWEPFIALNGQKMNLQVATHRDSGNAGTWVTVGTPIITVEY